MVIPHVLKHYRTHAFLLFLRVREFKISHIAPPSILHASFFILHLIKNEAFILHLMKASLNEAFILHFPKIGLNPG